MNLADTGLDCRIVNTLDQEGVFTVRQLLSLTEEEFFGIPMVGKTVLTIIKNHFQNHRPYAWEPDCLADWMLERGIDPLVIATLLGYRFADIIERRKAIGEVKAAQHAHQLSRLADAELTRGGHVPTPREMPALQQEAKEWYAKLREDGKIKRRKGKPAIEPTAGQGTKRIREKTTVRLCLPMDEQDDLASERGWM